VSVLWRGNWATRTRIASGLVLFTYALLHFLNIGLGLISPYWMEQAQTWRQVVTRSLPGEIVLYGAMLAHAGLAIVGLAGRRTLRMPIWEAVQITLGLVIPLMLMEHIVHTRVAHQVYGVNDDFGYILALIWGKPDAMLQSVLLLVVWTHGCIGLHFWLRSTRWWRQSLPYLIGFAALVPGFAFAGFLTEGRRIMMAFAAPDTRGPLMTTYNWPDQASFMALIRLTDYLLVGFWCVLALAAVFYLWRRFSGGRKSVQIHYVNGPVVASAKGPTLLEMSRANGIPHTALCGGRGRCTTCRVIVEEGAELLHPPSEAEARSLTAVNAPPNARLACQIKPTNPLTVFRVFRPDGRQGRAHASQGQERRLAILFLDMRGFTARTTGQLPYDVVFLLNRFFDAIVPCITGAGGTVDKYLGDGLLAVFETPDETTSAKAALQATAGIRSALIGFNKMLAAEGAPAVAIGIGLHLGDLVLGEIGAAGNAPRTLIGDTVNAASRLEGKTKELAVEVLVSEPLLHSAGVDTATLEMITLELRGVTEPLTALALPIGAPLPSLLNVPDADQPVPA
jgi:adenylate cyclase